MVQNDESEDPPKEAASVLTEVPLIPEWSPIIAESYSHWVMKNILGISKSLGVTFEGCEDQSLSIFSELDNRMSGRISSSEGNTSKLKKLTGGARELKRLQCTVNYDNRSKKNKGVGGVFENCQ